jgi:hypothetical protein
MELPWLGAHIMQYHNLQKDNFGTGSVKLTNNYSFE